MAICFAAVLINLSTSAQVQQAWVARYNNGFANGTNQAVKMALDSGGNIYVTGCSQNTNSNLGYVTIKYAPNGHQLWAARYDSSNSPAATPAAMVLDSSDEVIVTGSALTVKYDSNGTLVWTAPYAGTALAVDSNANAYVAGFSQNFGTAKLSPQGSNVWLTTFAEPYGATISQSVVVDNANNIYVSGLDTYYYVPPGGVGNGPYVTLTTIKYGHDGGQLWKQSKSPEPFYNSVQVAGAVLDRESNLCLAANYYSGNGYVVMKYSSDGNLDWTTLFGGTGAASSLSLDGSSNVVVTGSMPRNYPNYSYCTANLATNGTTIWMSFYPQGVFHYPESPIVVSQGRGIVSDAANDTYVTGYSPGTNSGNDIVTIKYGPNGNQMWLQRYNGPGNGDNEGNAIAVDNNGNVYVAGYDTTAAGGTEMVLIKYSPLTVQRRADGTVLLQAQGSPGESFDVQASTNLTTWLDLGSATADTNGLVQFDDTNAPQYNWRFYITSPQ